MMKLTAVALLVAMGMAFNAQAQEPAPPEAAPAPAPAPEPAPAPAPAPVPETVTTAPLPAPAAVAMEEVKLEKVLRHTVFFRYKPEVKPETKEEVIKRFAALKDEIPFILSFEGGPNVQVENLGDGFEHVFCVTFPDAEARDAYLPHPAHQFFVGFVGPLLDKVIVGDYWAPVAK